MKSWSSNMVASTKKNYIDLYEVGAIQWSIDTELLPSLDEENIPCSQVHCLYTYSHLTHRV